MMSSSREHRRKGTRQIACIQNTNRDIDIAHMNLL